MLISTLYTLTLTANLLVMFCNKNAASYETYVISKKGGYGEAYLLWTLRILAHTHLTFLAHIHQYGKVYPLAS